MGEIECPSCNELYGYQLIYDNDINDLLTNEICCPNCNATIIHVEPAAKVVIINYNKQVDNIKELSVNE